ncbi:hypothetical protein [Phenylobacterium sp.]|uniref:hypothetical protein n=1 Tax=Phenylobacterium sp. TaxID=1871053 RepID=UPI003BA88187
MLFVATPAPALAQGAVWLRHKQVLCIGEFYRECDADGSKCVGSKSKAVWKIDFPRKLVTYVGSDYTEDIVAFIDDDEAMLLSTGRLLRFHSEEGSENFTASLLGTLSGRTFVFHHLNCKPSE